MKKISKVKMKQCDVQFKKNGEYSTLWVPLIDAIEKKEIKIENRILKIDGIATVIKVYNGIIIES